MFCMQVIMEEYGIVDGRCSWLTFWSSRIILLRTVLLIMKALRRKIIRAYLTAGPTDHVFYDNTVLAYQVPGYLNNGTIKQLCVTK